jgi:hypothetical protein
MRARGRLCVGLLVSVGGWCGVAGRGLGIQAAHTAAAHPPPNLHQTLTNTCARLRTPPAPRPHRLRLKLDGPYDSRVLPILLAVTLITSLLVVFSGAIARLHSDV